MLAQRITCRDWKLRSFDKKTYSRFLALMSLRRYCRFDIIWYSIREKSIEGEKIQLLYKLLCNFHVMAYF